MLRTLTLKNYKKGKEMKPNYKDYLAQVEDNKLKIPPMEQKKWEALPEGVKVKEYTRDEEENITGIFYTPTELIALSQCLHGYIESLEGLANIQPINELKKQYDDMPEADDKEVKAKKDVKTEIDRLAVVINDANEQRKESVYLISTILKDMGMFVYEPENLRLNLLNKIVNMRENHIPTSLFHKEIIEPATIDIAMYIMVNGYQVNKNTQLLLNRTGMRKLQRNKRYFTYERPGNKEH